MAVCFLWLTIALFAPAADAPAPPPPSAGPDRSLPWVTPAARAPRVEFRTFQSRTVGAKVSYHVYMPPAYDEPGRRLPVLYWLHGTGGGIGGIAPVAGHFDAEMRAGRIPPMIVVFVNGLPRRLWADSKSGSSPVETVFITEVIPDVDNNLRTIAARQGRIVEGFSMGGYGAARLGFRHPHLFAGISVLAGGPFDLELDGPRARRNPRLRETILRDVCNGDLAYFRAISPLTIAESAAGGLRRHRTVIRHAVGGRDDTLDLNRQFHERLKALEVVHEFVEVPEVGHDCPGLLQALGERNGSFYRAALGAPAAADPPRPPPALPPAPPPG